MKIYFSYLFLFIVSSPLFAQELAQTYFVNAEIQLVLGDTIGALNNYNNAAYFHEDPAEKQHYQGYIKYLQKNYIGAIEDYTQALAIEPTHPNNASLYFDRALANEKLGHSKEAIADYGLATQVQPTYLSGYLSRAKLFARYEEFDLAIENFTAVIRLDAEHSEAYLLRGMAQLGAKKYQAAIEDFAKAIELNPDQTQALAYKKTAEHNLNQTSQPSSRL